MQKLVAIGGGEIGRPGTKVETSQIDKEIIKMSGKKNPRLLFIPTASSDSSGYFELVKKHFGKRLGCKVDALFLIKEKISEKEIEKKIFSSDIIYVGGGNTLKMMKIWRKFGVDKMLVKAHKKGIVLSGLSAGSICWFRYGNSDSLKFSGANNPLIKVKGLGLINALHCPHYDAEPYRQKDLKRMMKKTPGVAIALDNCTALEVIDDKYRIIKSKKSAKARKCFWNKGKYFVEEIKSTNGLKPLILLLLK